MHELDEFEDEQIARFRDHPVLRRVDRLTDVEFHEVVLQRRFLSLAFTPAYDLAIDLLSDQQTLRVARAILREEYPDEDGRTPSHREEMTEDILRLGVRREDLVRSRPSPCTVETITRTLELIAVAGAGEYPDTGLITILRFWGEVLVSVEYEQLWRRIGPLLGDRSTFYLPHKVHDAKIRPLAEASPLASTHSDQLGLRLWQRLDSPEEQKVFRRTEEAVVDVKAGFYDQFRR
ncbi:hypothetical protein BLA60_08500 [Actinophytocola xinjiangensis]|uniref:Uncharacterized protein n=1 Tax=Actinophytocola xinjiangensis TaxID=485602 RepID=A0A7Z1AZJ6_9PSEU|nr:hypothetical protein [Actinophytocola xinjiangensis]OLF12055.1 hypothetical protein BLA60_08500 [Actinophytocola xinjiangensis]